MLNKAIIATLKGHERKVSRRSSTTLVVFAQDSGENFGNHDEAITALGRTKYTMGPLNYELLKRD